MERKIPVPLTLEDLRRDPDLIFAVHAHARRERARMAGAMVHAVHAWISAALRHTTQRLQSTRWALAALATK
jgi:hypothetical protein